MTARLRMPFHFGLLFVFSALMLCAAVAAAAPAPAPNQGVVVRRFALITGASKGGSGRVPLRYAASDARNMKHVLTELGGIGEANTILLLDVDRARLREGFERLRRQVATAASPGARTEIVFYYSGHSDESGLLLGEERVTYQEVRAWVEQTGADVRIAVLDSCASGALTRAKGGVHRPPFLVDTSSAARGHAYLTASSENESAQESDRVGAAYFTHYLVSGLRGAADVSRDGRVTLSEAYQYAFTETLARTETSRGGPQHASYDFQLTGKGDLVMTDLHATNASLVLPPELSGRLFVRDSSGQLVAEVHKLADQPIELGLPPGHYKVTLDQPRRLSETNVDLEAGQQTTLLPKQLVALAPTAAVARGPGEAEPGAVVAAAPAPVGPPTHAVNLSLFPGADTNGGVPSHNAFVFGLVARSASLSGVSATLAHYTDGDVSGLQLGYFGAGSGGRLRGLQLTGLAAFAEGDVRGGQVGSFATWTRGRLTGFQLSGLAAGASGGEGAQISGIVNLSRGSFRGVQLAGIANVTDVTANDLHARGVQAAGIANVQGGEFRGVQLAGIANVTREARGAQISGVVNLAERMNGLQLSVINIGGDVRGGQLGVINIAKRVRGGQLGVINIADEVDGVPFGLVNVIRNGIHELELSTTDMGASVIGGVLGNQRFYVRMGFGVMARASDIPGAHVGTIDATRYLVQWGFGVRLRPTDDDRLFLDLEAVSTNYHQSPQASFDDDDAVTGSLRALFGYRFARNFALVGGPSINTSVGWSANDSIPTRDFAEAVFHSGGTTVRLYPGLVLGLRI